MKPLVEMKSYGTLNFTWEISGFPTGTLLSVLRIGKGDCEDMSVVAPPLSGPCWMKAVKGTRAPVPTACGRSPVLGQPVQLGQEAALLQTDAGCRDLLMIKFQWHW